MRFTWLEDPLRLTCEDELLRLAWLELLPELRFTWEDEAGREAEEELVERVAELELELEFRDEPPVRDWAVRPTGAATRAIAIVAKMVILLMLLMIVSV